MSIRTICVAVAEVLEGGTKQEFYADLRASLDFAVKVANLAASECLRQDDLQLEKPPKIYTYPEMARRGITKGASNPVSSIARSVEKSYLKDRWHVARGKRSIRNYRSQPWPLLNNKTHQTIELDDRGEFIAAKIKLRGGSWIVRLAGGEAYRNQIRGLRNAISYGDSKIWVDRKHRAIVGISCELKDAEARETRGTMNVSGSRESLLVATLERSDVPYVINADICKQWKSEANRRYQRLRQDSKSDANRRLLRREMSSIAEKMNRRMKTLCHEASSRIVKHAVRNRVAEIKLDLTIKSYCDSFPWHTLAGMIKYKAEKAGLKLTNATQSVAEPDTEKPHIYFKYAAIANRIKIGMTGREDGGRHGAETDSPEELTILAIDNQPKTKLRARENHFKALFQEHCIKGEWFQAEPILAWLRETGWLGNAGNLSQIAQVLDVSQDAIPGGHLKAEGECASRSTMDMRSHNADNFRGYSGQSQTALVVSK